jgi:hypothetical protein
MCNLYSDHHQPSRHHRSVPRDKSVRRQPAADAWRLPGLPGARGAQQQRRTRTHHDALGNAASGARAGGYPVTNIRNVSSPHWRACLKPELVETWRQN